MKTTNQAKQYKTYNAIQKRVWELEDALKKLIDEHRAFQIDQDLKKYEAILYKKFIYNINEEHDDIVNNVTIGYSAS